MMKHLVLKVFRPPDLHLKQKRNGDVTVKQFSYVLKLKMGIHARPAALLADRVKFSGAKVMVKCNGHSAKGTDIMGLMGLNARKDDEVLVTIEGETEETVAEELNKLFQENF